MAERNAAGHLGGVGGRTTAPLPIVDSDAAEPKVTAVRTPSPTPEQQRAADATARAATSRDAEQVDPFNQPKRAS